MFYSSPNCTFFIVDIQGDLVAIEDAYAIRSGRTDVVMPYYNWSGRELKRFIDGTTITEGSLVLNVNSLNYLQNLILGNRSEGPTNTGLLALESSLVNFTSSTLREESTLNSEKTKAIAESKLINSGILNLRILKERHKFNSKLSDTASEDAFSKEVDLVVYGGDQERERLTKVRFTGKSYEISASSSMNIKYAFPFVAQRSSI